MYIEGLREYREQQKIEKLVQLMNKEAEDYYQQCSYFMNYQLKLQQQDVGAFNEERINMEEIIAQDYQQ